MIDMALEYIGNPKIYYNNLQFACENGSEVNHFDWIEEMADAGIPYKAVLRSQLQFL